MRACASAVLDSARQKYSVIASVSTLVPALQAGSTACVRRAAKELARRFWQAAVAGLSDNNDTGSSVMGLRAVASQHPRPPHLVQNQVCAVPQSHAPLLQQALQPVWRADHHERLVFPQGLYLPLPASCAMGVLDCQGARGALHCSDCGPSSPQCSGSVDAGRHAVLAQHAHRPASGVDALLHGTMSILWKQPSRY